MSIKGNLLRAGQGVTGGKSLKSRPWAKQVAGLGLNFLLGFSTSFARVFSVSAPFGVAMVARSGGGSAGASCLIGSVLGYIVSGGFDWGIRYVAAAVLVYTASFVFQSIAVYDNQWFMPLMTAGICLITGLLSNFSTLGYMPTAVLLVTEMLLAAGATYFFVIVLSGEDRTTELMETRYDISLVIFVSILLMALSRLVIADAISVGRVFAVLVVMTASLKSGAVFGSASGAAFGFAIDVAYGGSPFYTMAYAFSGMISGLTSKHGRLLFVLSFMSANIATVLWTWSSVVRIDALFECFVASVIFMLLPSEALDYVGGQIRQPRLGAGDTGLRKYTSERIEKMSLAFRELFSTVYETLECSANDADISTAFDRAADAVCVSCKSKEKCWHDDYIDTLTIINDASPKMVERGRLERSDLASRFISRCKSVDALVGTVNSELRSVMYRKRFRSRISENRMAAYGQYLDIAEILASVSKDLGTDCKEEPLAERRLIRYLGSIDIDAKVSVFRDSKNRLRASIDSVKCAKLLSDKRYIEELSTVVGVRLCCDKTQDTSKGRLLFMEAEPLSVSVGIASLKKHGESVSGDRGTYFKTDEGILSVVLSDGMGSGTAAAKESVDTVKILENFLKSGVAPELAMKMLNSVALLRSSDSWGYATADLMCIDLFSGDTSFYKYGAAPSYVWNGRNIQRVKGESLVPGFGIGEAAEPDIVRMRLRVGNRAVIISDGVIGDGEDRWLRDMLSKSQEVDVRSQARDILRKATEKNGSSDDMTVLVVHVQERA